MATSAHSYSEVLQLEVLTRYTLLAIVVEMSKALSDGVKLSQKRFSEGARDWPARERRVGLLISHHHTPSITPNSLQWYLSHSLTIHWSFLVRYQRVFLTHQHPTRQHVSSWGLSQLVVWSRTETKRWLPKVCLMNYLRRCGTKLNRLRNRHTSIGISRKDCCINTCIGKNRLDPMSYGVHMP